MGSEMCIRDRYVAVAHGPITMQAAVASCLAHATFTVNGTTGDCSLPKLHSAIPVPARAPAGALGHFQVDIRSCNGIVAATAPHSQYFFGPIALVARGRTQDLRTAHQVSSAPNLWLRANGSCAVLRRFSLCILM